ncbi:DUF805 domain-containing protein [Isoptericola sp. NEAU-Y5]|uniref:DUF805 domain-containing protein n=1 Tax=Isoptericola luteus TaxID=2879484 RepID=A0ABS7ZJK2_9MICO|nr:DUF805 domain-containing protein [Isoptericola sp. NEAU-Y5]MCA5894531.1 DUF805 domain-containing protein [Isoptericola sp. NEAU-Y5]
MSFPDAVKSVFSQYATFSGRARRSEFWFWFLFQAIIGAILSIVLTVVMAGSVASATIDPVTGEISGAALGGGLAVYGVAGLVGLALTLPTIAVTVRRLHDQDKSGLFWFLSLIPFVGAIILIVMCASPGTVGANQYGADPKLAQAPSAAPVAA